MSGTVERAAVHAALGDPLRLAIVEALAIEDLTPSDLAASLLVPGNLLAHHLAVLERAGVVERRISEGDRRRRYLTLRRNQLSSVRLPVSGRTTRNVLFVCTHNSARSQFAAALWRRRTGGGESAGTMPADRVHPKAVRAAADLGVELSDARPRGYDAVRSIPDLVVSVCDRAAESGHPWDVPDIHWSIPDPVAAGRIDGFRTAFAEIAARVAILDGGSAG
jgi:protein-tyrosine-phosphatase/DNA-binding HxlR family transcriptional regulator